MKKICALTQVRNDDFFLRKWIEYYGKELGKENLYVYMDGEDQIIPDFCEGVNVTVSKKIQSSNVVKFDKIRIKYLSERAAELFKEYDIVIGTDCDEFLVVEPNLGVSLKEHLSSIESGTSVSGLGIDVGQHRKKEEPIDGSVPLLGQRRFGYLSTRYTKTNTLLKPVCWGSGFHRVKAHNFHIDPYLFLFHFGSMDYNTLADRYKANGLSERHLRKRTRTIQIISEREAKEWAPTTQWAAKVQQKNRPIYALNKPSMWNRKVVVEIPERFFGIV